MALDIEENSNNDVVAVRTIENDSIALMTAPALELVRYEHGQQCDVCVMAEEEKEK